MKFSELSEIIKKDVPLHYRNEYTAKAMFNSADGKAVSKRIEFTVEMSPIGTKDIRINFVDNLDYPLVPILKVIKEEIQVLDRKGLLL